MRYSSKILAQIKGSVVLTADPQVTDFGSLKERKQIYFNRDLINQKSAEQTKKEQIKDSRSNFRGSEHQKTIFDHLKNFVSSSNPSEKKIKIHSSKNLIDSVLEKIKDGHPLSIHTYLQVPDYFLAVINQKEYFSKEVFRIFCNPKIAETKDSFLNATQRHLIQKQIQHVIFEIYQIFILNHPQIIQEEIFENYIDDIQEHYLKASLNNVNSLMTGIDRQELDAFVKDFLNLHVQNKEVLEKIVLYQSTDNRFTFLEKIYLAKHIPIQFRYAFIKQLLAQKEIIEETLDHFFEQVIDNYAQAKPCLHFINSQGETPLDHEAIETSLKSYIAYLTELDLNNFGKSLESLRQNYEYFFFIPQTLRASHKYFTLALELISEDEKIISKLGKKNKTEALLELFKILTREEKLEVILKWARTLLKDRAELKKSKKNKSKIQSELINDYGSSEIYSRIEEAKARYAEYSKDPSAFSQTMLPPSENPEDYHQTGYSAEKPRYRKYYQETYKNLYLLPPAGTALFTAMSLMLKSKKKSEKEKALAFFKVIAQKVRKYNIHLSSPQNFKNPKKTFVRIVESEHKDYLPDEES